MENIKEISAVCAAVLGTDIAKATKFISPKFIIRATRIGKIDKRDKRIDVRLTIGKPNFAEREFIEKLQEAKEPFPVKKILLKIYKPKSKSNLKKKK